ncbi:DUF917 family protein [Nanohaloarchaea archaeon H01]|nr:DUF917 family protein [Nanohaloarchaea archaeon H01]
MDALRSDSYLTEPQNLENYSSISSENIEQVLRGASILSGGGGGSYSGALDNFRTHYPNEVEVRGLDEFSADDNIATVFGLGPVNNDTEDPIEIAEESVEMYESEYGQIDGLILGELGPHLIVEAVTIADRLDVPVVDADVAGMRAVPSIQNEIIEESEISRTPLVATNGEESEYIEDGSGQEIEREVRELTEGDIWYITGYANTAEGYSDSVPEGWLDECIGFGQSEMDRVVQGTLESVEYEQIDGHTVGRMIIGGDGTVEVYFQNENILAYLNGEEVARAPDTISVVDSDGVGVYNGSLPEEGEDLEVYQITNPFWQDTECFDLPTLNIDADGDRVNFEENTEYIITGGQE